MSFTWWNVGVKESQWLAKRFQDAMEGRRCVAGSDFLQAAPERAMHETAKLKYQWRSPRMLEMIGPWESSEENDGHEVKLIQGKGHLCCRSRAGKKKKPASWGVGSTDDAIMSPRCQIWSSIFGVALKAINLAVAQWFLALPPFSSFGVRMFLLFHCFLKACSLICISYGLTFKRFVTPCTSDTGTGGFKLCRAWNPPPWELALLVPEVLCKLLKEKCNQRSYPAETLWTAAAWKDISKAVIVPIISWC